MRATEYTLEEMKKLLDNMSGMYDYARVVDPMECRILQFDKDGRISRKESCYGIWNAEQRCVNCSSALACRTGCHQEKAERFQDQVFRIQSNPVKLRMPDGGVCDAVVELVSVEKKTDENAAAANDRAAENEQYRAVRYLARHDDLTKVLQTGAFYELARDTLTKSPDVPWMMITANVMGFRLVNSLFGVQRGNEALIRIATELRQIADAAGGLCGRIGGDSFALLLRSEDYEETAFRSAADALAEAFSSGVYTFRIHFGVYEIADASIPVSVMCDRANMALRTIREDLKACVARFDEHMMRESLYRQEIISGFEEALRQEQFEMYLQPIVGETGAACGAEALVRWRRPDGSVIKPCDFIETLERAGLVHELDAYMWERAVRQLAAWKGTEKESLTISVNMSAKDFYSIDVYRVLTGLVETYGVDCGRLRVEITETAMLEEPEKSNEVIARLRERGFLVEIDDFGKGFSSLSLLKDIRADVLKIDMSFLREIEKNPRSRIILESVIRMADSLGMEVVTEGVETRSQLEALTEMGCRHFQGYLFSRPVPVDAFEQQV